ncbi:MAG: hypothetical protein WC525_09070 [Candidatus Thermoplasmatota archaeon]
MTTIEISLHDEIIAKAEVAMVPNKDDILSLMADKKFQQYRVLYRSMELFQPSGSIFDPCLISGPVTVVVAEL